jgi:predicted transcriptional regulator
MEEHGVSVTELSAVLGISRIAFYLKMWGIKRWNLADAVKLCGFFHTPDAEHLFVRNNNKRQFLESQEENGNV